MQNVQPYIYIYIYTHTHTHTYTHTIIQNSTIDIYTQYAEQHNTTEYPQRNIHNDKNT